ncbi:TetR/AcrR family transcriptional regulator [Roseinatronobacter alkalisoli]|uniref:TetR family transcriptional regulator C-terminal domain-containing protein n=1 Tax=Roseinatronobacter alkalisoli TaxID=3028235 RepID=A0ABT5T902_9RHOB|nr:TetR family transcriptional regulator C-terminal domain-containing protein [Roseinatronobacter sp. HJB301]MDD7970861.1 TetR family transcriptional regulator C-terminal domain-containing protein [Roseinatronobacter sp. HJB301]
MPVSDKSAPSRREQLVEATIALVLEVGLRAVKTRDVTERAGVGTGLLNHYFRWPELRALAWARLFEEVTQSQFASSGDPREDLERYFTTAFTMDSRRYWHLWMEAAELAATDEPMKTVFAKMSVHSRGGLCDLLRAGCAKGIWNLENPEETAIRLSAMYDGLAGMLLSPAEEMHPEKAEAHLRRAFANECRGL